MEQIRILTFVYKKGKKKNIHKLRSAYLVLPFYCALNKHRRDTNFIALACIERCLKAKLYPLIAAKSH